VSRGVPRCYLQRHSACWTTTEEISGDHPLFLRRSVAKCLRIERATLPSVGFTARPRCPLDIGCCPPVGKTALATRHAFEYYTTNRLQCQDQVHSVERPLPREHRAQASVYCALHPRAVASRCRPLPKLPGNRGVLWIGSTSRLCRHAIPGPRAVSPSWAGWGRSAIARAMMQYNCPRTIARDGAISCVGSWIFYGFRQHPAYSTPK
jgi:hypothetical protein